MSGCRRSRCVQRGAATRSHRDQSMLWQSNHCATRRSAKAFSRRSKSVRSSKLPQANGRVLILTAFYSAQRLGDCANLRWRNVDLVSEIKTMRFSRGKTSAKSSRRSSGARRLFVVAANGEERRRVSVSKSGAAQDTCAVAGISQTDDACAN